RVVEVLREERRHETEERQAEVRLDLVGRLDAIVEVLEEERDADREREPAEEGEQQVRGDVRARRPPRRLGLIDHADVARLQLAGNTRFIIPLHESLEYLSICHLVSLTLVFILALTIRFR